MIAAERGSDSTEAIDVHAAADELMTANETLTRRLLGTDEGAERDWPTTDVSERGRRRGWFAYAPHPSRLPLDG